MRAFTASLALAVAVFLLASACGGGEGPTGWIAFRSDRDGNSEIYVMKADGSDLTNLTKSPYGDFDPTWSPDRSRIAFSSARCRSWAWRQNSSSHRHLPPEIG